MEDAGIDPATSRMQSARSTIWANPPAREVEVLNCIYRFAQNRDEKGILIFNFNMLAWQYSLWNYNVMYDKFTKPPKPS